MMTLLSANNSCRLRKSGTGACTRAVLIAVMLAVAAGGCSMFKKDEVLPDEPGDKLYNEGL
jgi:hypothetical protein